MYKALKECKFNRKYGIGEMIPADVADQECFDRAVAYGYIALVPDVKEEIPEEEETPEEGKRRGRKRAVK